MNGHTKGPWKINGNYIQTDEKRPRIIAEIYQLNDDNNSRLIANAPELLEFVKWLYTSVLDNKSDPTGDIRVKAVKLISKANGE